MIKFSCGTSTLMLVRGQLVTCVFALHAPVRSSAAILQHLIVSPPISGFWAAGAFGSSSCVWCSHVFGHRVSVPYPVPMHCAHALCPCAHALCPCVESGVVKPSASVAEASTTATGSATGSHQIDYCGTALVADQSHRVCCTPTQHTVRWEWEACLHSSSSGKLCLCSENHFSPQDKWQKVQKKWVLETNRFVGFL